MIEDVLEAAKRGMRGEVIERPLVEKPGKLSKLGKTMSLGKGKYILFGGASGSGKTSVCDSEFVLKPINDYLENGGVTPYYIYRAMERPLLEKKAKWLAWKIYNDTGIIYDIATILGWQNKKKNLTQDDISLFESYSDYFKDVYRFVDIVPGATSPKEILNYALRRAYQMGKFCYTEGKSVFVNGKNIGEFDGQELKQDVLRSYKDLSFGRIWEGEQLYFESVPNAMVIHVTDHLIKLTDNQRQEMSLINEHGSNMGNILRDVIKWTVLDIMQFNREQYDTYRNVKTKLDVTEQDFRGSSIPYHNADIVLGLLNPHKMQKTRHSDYELDKMITVSGGEVFNRFRAVHIVKNSYGGDEGVFGIMLVGENGYVKFLPKADELRDIDYEDISNGIF